MREVIDYSLAGMRSTYVPAPDDWAVGSAAWAAAADGRTSSAEMTTLAARRPHPHW